MAAISDWRSFWDQSHSIYVNDRHRDVHYRDVAEQIAEFVPAPTARVLDYGCGEANHADCVAAVAAQVMLCDAAPNVRAALEARFADHPKMRVLSPENVEALPQRSLDLIVANSLVQYVNPADLERLLALWRRLIAPGGTLIVADVIPPEVGTLSDVVALLRYAAANGFLLAALAGLARTAMSGYGRLRARLGIAKYSEREFLAKLAAAGFDAERLPRNMEHNPARMTFRARPG